MTEPTVRKVSVRNPRTGEVDYHFASPTDEALGERARELREAQRVWRATTVSRRIELMESWAAALERHRDAIVTALTVDTGRYLISVTEHAGVVGSISRWCANASELLVERDGRSLAQPSIAFRSQLVPYPLVGVISPWNFPLTLALIDAIPALLAGCAVLIKPSEVAPRFAEPLRASIAEVPEIAAVLDILPGDGRTGSALVGVVDAVCFTGSVRTGRAVAQSAAQHFIPAFLELGGKDPVIVTKSARIDRAAATVLRASVLATGQACQSLERVYVDAAIHDEFVDRLVEKAKAVAINYPDLHRGHVGPLIFARQAEVIAGQIADARSKGARVLCGGEIENHGGGLWVRPSVLVDVDHSMQVMREETFGPIMPVMGYANVEEAIQLANDTDYGLSAAVISGSVEEAEAIGRQIDAGAISLNDGALTGVMNEAEKHSFKLSGMGGSRMGPAGLTRFLRKKALISQTGTPATIEMYDEANARRR